MTNEAIVLVTACALIALAVSAPTAEAQGCISTYVNTLAHAWRPVPEVVAWATVALLGSQVGDTLHAGDGTLGDYSRDTDRNYGEWNAATADSWQHARDVTLVGTLAFIDCTV